MNNESRTELAHDLANYINKNGSVRQETFNPEYTAKVWIKGEIIRIYVRNGGKDCGNLTIEADGTVGEKYAKLGNYGWELVASALASREEKGQ